MGDFYTVTWSPAEGGGHVPAVLITFYHFITSKKIKMNVQSYKRFFIFSPPPVYITSTGDLYCRHNINFVWMFYLNFTNYNFDFDQL